MKLVVKSLLVFLLSFLMVDTGYNLLIAHGQNGVFELTVGSSAFLFGVFLVCQKIIRRGSLLKQVSSELTICIRFFLPIMLLVFSAYFFWEIIASIIQKDYEYLIGLLVLLTVMLVLLYLVVKYSSKIMEIRYSDKDVVISNFRKRETVSIDQIGDVYSVFLFIQCLTLKEETAFGRKIYFLSSIYETLASVNQEPSSLKDFKRTIFVLRKDIFNNYK